MVKKNKTLKKNSYVCRVYFFNSPFKPGFILLKNMLILHRKNICSKKTGEHVYFLNHGLHCCYHYNKGSSKV